MSNKKRLEKEKARKEGQWEKGKGKKKADKTDAHETRALESMTKDLATESADQHKGKEMAEKRSRAKKLVGKAAKKALALKAGGPVTKEAKKDKSVAVKKNAMSGTKAKAVPRTKKTTKDPVPPNHIPEDSGDEATVDGGDATSINGRVALSVEKVAGVVKKRKKTEGLQLESAACRARGRAGVAEVPCDEFGCKHVGIMDILDSGKVSDASWMKHHLQKGGYLEGEHCAECGKPAEDVPLTKPKGEKNPVYENVCYVCVVGTRPRNESENCNTFFCPGCVVLRIERLEASRKAERGDSSKRVSTRKR
jgi:hypothetical protein